MNLKSAFFILLLQVFLSISLIAQENQTIIYKTMDDDNSKFTDVGNIGLTVTNFGTYGHGFHSGPINRVVNTPKDPVLNISLMADYGLAA